jgi:ribA/ribD-fused uncharacterized protein
MFLILRVSAIITGNYFYQPTMKNWRTDHPDAILFSRETDPKYGIFSNFYALGEPLIYEEKTYPTTEHLYQCLKFMGPASTDKDLEYAEHIRKTRKPFASKILGGLKIKHLPYEWVKPLNKLIMKYKETAKVRTDWENGYKKEAMMICLRAKFNSTQKDKDGRLLKDILLETGDKVICEDSPWDAIWGIGSDGKGLNWLGESLMKLREELRK